MTDAPPIGRIAVLEAAAQAALHALNNANAEATSFLTDRDWEALVTGAFSATCVPDAAALLIAFDQDADYASPNFRWFRARRERFVYVDRVVVADTHRGRGLGTNLYRDLFRRAAEAGHDRVVCEVNFDPPNPVSDAFHAGMGFAEVGRAELTPGGKTVRYYERLL